MEAIILGPDEGELVGSGPASAVLKATSISTGGGFSMSETTIQAGFPGPPPHSHTRLTDTFYVLDGTLTVRVGEEKIDAPPGSYVCIPPGTVHTFSNESSAPVRFLNINSPAGWENYLRDIAELMSGDSSPTPLRGAL